jgi:hypothetical protein
MPVVETRGGSSSSSSAGTGLKRVGDHPLREEKVIGAEAVFLDVLLHRDVNVVKTQDWGRTSRRQDWREVQANRGMAALLMPSRTFKDVAFDQITKLGLSDLHSSPDSAEPLATAIVDIYQVSKQAALIRLGTLQLV